MAEPWQCPACLTWVRGDVAEHRCGPDGDVKAEVPAPPSTPPPAAVSMSHPWQWWSTATSGTGSAVTLTFPSVKILAQEVMREMQRGATRYGGLRPLADGHLTRDLVREVREGGVMSIDDARRELGKDPWGDSDAAS